MTTITRHRGHTSLALSLIAALALAVPAQRARAASDSNPGVLPPNSYAYGKTYGGWSAAYWHWAISIPAHDNPFLDDTGAHCGAGQSGPVWFLAYVINPVGTLQRQCTVPAGKALFVPVFGAWDVHVPGFDTEDGTAQGAWDDLHSAAGLGFSFSGLYAKIDRVPVSNLDSATTPYRACAGPAADGCTAPPFSLFFPGDDFYGFGVPTGTYGPAVADGVYLLLAPLKPGAHTITVGGTFSIGGQFSGEITYHLVVSSG